MSNPAWEPVKAIVLRPNDVIPMVQYELPRMMEWVPRWRGAESRVLETWIFECCQAIDLAAREMERKRRQFNPYAPDLRVALLSLLTMGLSPSPSKGEAALLMFREKRSSLLRVTPCPMIGGLKKIAAEIYPITEWAAGIVLAGDEWDHWEDETGSHFKWKRAQTKNRAPLMAASGAIDWLNLIAGWVRISFSDGREPLSAVVSGESLREKIANNRNYTKALVGNGGQRERDTYSPWSTSTLAMIRKTLVKSVIRDHLPLSGAPAASLRLANLHESGDREQIADHLSAALGPEPPPEASELLRGSHALPPVTISQESENSTYSHPSTLGDLIPSAHPPSDEYTDR